MSRNLLFALVGLALVFFASPAKAQNFFMATGTGSQEVTVEPTGLETESTCVLTFRILNDETMLSYILQCFNMSEVTQAHIHLGNIHENGPSVIDLIKARDLNPTGPINGLLQQGTLTDENVKTEETTLADVLQAMRSDETYFNVHTETNPKGEVRGQISVIQDKKIVDEFFLAAASGTNQMPEPVLTEAKCLASFRVPEGESQIKYKLKCWNITEVTQAHIHVGQGTGTGNFVAFLFPLGDPTGPINGFIKRGDDKSKGTLTAADLTNDLKGMTISDLVNLMRSDAAYLNVHTAANLPGEVRAQITLIESLGGF